MLPGEGASGDTLGAVEVALLEKKSSWEKVLMLVSPCCHGTINFLVLSIFLQLVV